MKRFLKSVCAEAVKQHKNYFHSKMIYVSLFVWPLISFVSAYYSFKPFNIQSPQIPYLNEQNLILFILLGYLCMNFFRTLVQSAWFYSHERQAGTLELIYLTPVNRIGIILGNVLSSAFESVWVMVIFSGGILLLKRHHLNLNVPAALTATAFMMVMAISWGLLLNALFLFSRDTGFLFTILEEPMEIFSGVKVPTTLFPLWAKIISQVFPLTYALEAMRSVFLNGKNLYELKAFIGTSVIIIFVLLSLASGCLLLGEKHAKKTGNMSLF